MTTPTSGRLRNHLRDYNLRVAGVAGPRVGAGPDEVEGLVGGAPTLRQNRTQHSQNGIPSETEERREPRREMAELRVAEATRFQRHREVTRSHSGRQLPQILSGRLGVLPTMDSVDGVGGEALIVRTVSRLVDVHASDDQPRSVRLTAHSTRSLDVPPLDSRS